MGILALDDRDATIVYSTGWSQAGVSEEFNSTTTFTSTVGATAKVTFFGTKVSVRGTIGSSLTRRPSSSYAIDTGTATTFQGDPGLSVKFNQLFYESPDLPAGQHTLTITNTGNDANLFLDVIMVTPLDTPMITTVTTTATPPVVTSARTVTVTQSASGSPSGTAAGSTGGAPPGASQKSSNTGAIVGGIIGALVLLILLVGGFLFYRKRERQMRANGPSGSAYDWNAKSTDAPSPPTPPFAPQFQSSAQPQMAQATGGSAGYGSYEPWQYPNSAQNAGYPAPPRQYALPSTYTPQSNPLPPLPPRQSSELAYDVSEAYGGVYEQQGPYPPLPTRQNPTGRVRVNLDG